MKNTIISLAIGLTLGMTVVAVAFQSKYETSNNDVQHEVGYGYYTNATGNYLVPINLDSSGVLQIH